MVIERISDMQRGPDSAPGRTDSYIHDLDGTAQFRIADESGKVGSDPFRGGRQSQIHAGFKRPDR